MFSSTKRGVHMIIILVTLTVLTWCYLTRNTSKDTLDDAVEKQGTTSNNRGVTGQMHAQNMNTDRDTLEDDEHDDVVTRSSKRKVPRTLSEACAQAAGDRKEIIMSVIGSSHRDIYMNFYYTSILKHNITNALFIASDHAACENFETETVNHETKVTCFVYKEDADSQVVSRWDSTEYIRKVNYKTQFALEILNLGFTVLISDIDEVYLKNPLPLLRKICPRDHCDVAAQWNLNDEYNSGFVYVRPTAKSVELYTIMYALFNERGIPDQDTLNIALNSSGLVVVRLDSSLFATGPAFFPNNNRCPSEERYNSTVVVHNNYLKYVEDKVQRFKDCKLWDYDGQYGYYSNASRKYIMYSNTLDTRNRTAIKNAIFNGLLFARILNRVFLLPSVEPYPYLRPHYVIIKLFKNSTPRFYQNFGTEIREDCFLEHPLVPPPVANSISPPYCITWITSSESCEAGSIVFTAKGAGPTKGELLDRFSRTKLSVLKINPTYEVFPDLNYTEILGDSVTKLWQMNPSIDLL